MSDHIAAAIAGGLTAMIGKVVDHLHAGNDNLLGASVVYGIDTLVTGFCIAYFLAPSMLIVFEKYLGITIMSGAVYFLLAHYGSDLSVQIRQMIKRSGSLILKYLGRKQ